MRSRTQTSCRHSKKPHLPALLTAQDPLTRCPGVVETPDSRVGVFVNNVIVAPATSTIRDIAACIPVGLEEGLDHDSVATPTVSRTNNAPSPGQQPGLSSVGGASRTLTPQAESGWLTVGTALGNRVRSTQCHLIDLDKIRSREYTIEYDQIYYHQGIGRYS